MKLSEYSFKNNIILYVSIIFMTHCFVAGVAQAADKCDSKKMEIVKGKETVWSGNAVDLFKQYPHGKLGIGNRPERETVRLSKLIKEVGAEKSSQVAVIACRNKSKQLATADIINGDSDVWLVGIRSGEIRILEYKKGMDKPKKDFKRVVRIHFIQ